MDRRRYLALAGSAAVGSLAGCAALGDPTPLSAGEVTHEERESYVSFHDGGDRVATFGVRHTARSPTRWDLQLSAWHDDATRFAAMRYELRTPPVGQGPIVQVYLERPGGGPWPDLTFDGDATKTVVEADDLGDLGDGTLILDLLLSATDQVEHLPVSVSCVYTLERDGFLAGEFAAEGTIEVDLTPSG